MNGKNRENEAYSQARVHHQPSVWRGVIWHSNTSGVKNIVRWHDTDEASLHTMYIAYH